MDELFIGSAICEVTDAGEILLPRRFHETAQLRSIDPTLFIGLHEESSCLVAFDRMYAMQRQFEVAERLAASPRAAQDYHRIRRLYGFVEAAPIDPDGMMMLPSVMRQRGAIGRSALLVAAGPRFEIWDLAYVLDHGPSDLITLATLLRVGHIANDVLANEVLHVPTVPSARSPSGGRRSMQSGLRVQPLPALSPRHDPVGGSATK